MKLRLQAKYTLSITAVIAVVALVLAAGLHMHFHHTSLDMAAESEAALAHALEYELKTEAVGVALFASGILANAIDEGDVPKAAALLGRSLDLHHALVYASAFDHDGQLLHTSGSRTPQVQRLALPAEPYVSYEADLLVATAPAYLGHRVVGAVRIALKHDGHAERVQELRTRISALLTASRFQSTLWSVALTLGLIGAGVLLGGWMARRMSQPITALARAVRHLPETPMLAMPVPVGHDEIAALTRAFGQMQARLNETTVSRDFLEAIIGGMHEGLVVTDGDGRIRLVNQATTVLLGESREALTGRLFADLFAFPFRYEDTDQSPVAETMLRRADNRAVLVAVSRSCFDTAEAGGSVFVIRDITEQKRLARELESYRSQLEVKVAARTRELTAALRELEAFSYSVSHDLHAPLRAINGFSAVLQEDYGDRLDESARDYLARMQAATVRMGELIDGLLALSRVVRVELVFEPVDLSQLAAEISDLLAAAEPARRVITRIEPGLQVSGDRRLLRALLHNLMENAWKFSRERSAAEIEIGAREHGGARVFFVRDNGDGFENTESQHLFEPFMRLRSDLPGTGLGLATAQRIVQRHGGQLWAESQPGAGAVFYFTLAGAYEESREPSRALLS